MVLQLQGDAGTAAETDTVLPILDGSSCCSLTGDTWIEGFGSPDRSLRNGHSLEEEDHEVKEGKMPDMLKEVAFPA